jgi:hypothetical protein
MGIFSRSVWVNVLGLISGTLVIVLAIAVAFLRFYDDQDFTFLGFIAQPRLGRNRLTVAALLAALANLGIVGQSPCVAWNRRNCLKTRFANEKQTTWLNTVFIRPQPRNPSSRSGFPPVFAGIWRDLTSDFRVLQPCRSII